MTGQEKVERPWIIAQHIIRKWQPVLTPAEFSVVMFILDRTLRYAKIQERIPIQHFVQGVPNVRGGCGLERSRVKEILRVLEERGVLHVTHRRPKGNLYALQIDWEPTDMGLKEPRKPKVSSRAAGIGRPGDLSLAGGVTYIGHSGDPLYKRGLEKGDLEKNGASRTAADAVHAALAEGKERRDARHAANMRKHKPTTGELWAVWQGAMSEEFPLAMVGPWSRKVQGQMKWLRDNVPWRECTVGEWLDWVVRNWDRIRAAKFPAKSARSRSQFSAPETPEIGFVLGLRDAFLEAWSARATLRADVALTGQERRVRALRRRGLTESEAQEAVGEARERVAERDRLAEERKALAQERRMLEAEQERARRAASPVARREITPRRGPIQIDFSNDSELGEIE